MFEIIEFCQKKEFKRITCDNYIVAKFKQGHYVVRVYKDGVWKTVYALINNDEYGVRIIGAGEGIVYEGGLLDNGFAEIKLVDRNGNIYDEYYGEDDAL